MSAKTTPRAAGRKPKNLSKSAWTRQLLDEGKSVAEITRIIPDMGYAFAYGVAKRYGKADTAASRRPQRAVTMVEGVVTVTLVDGTKVHVNRASGKVTRSRK